MSDTITIIPKCENVGCNNDLGYFDRKNGSRFCRLCKSNSHSVLRWKCKGCDVILYASNYRETKKYCDGCRRLFPKC